MVSWRLANSLIHLREQVNAKWPNRSKDSDGSIGDANHASRTSDHNPYITDPGGPNVVSAIDITHDPLHGFDSYIFADHLLAKQDERLKYVISNHRIGSGPSGPSPGKWRHYSGINPHDHHVHISVMPEKLYYDSTKDWDIDDMPITAEDATYVPPPPTLRRGNLNNGANQTLQGRLNAHGANLRVDGVFGSVTEHAVILFQQSEGLVADGVVGPQTWKALSA